MDRPRPEQFTEELVEKIIAGVKIGFDKQGYETTILRFGNKELIITFLDDSRLFKTHIENKKTEEPKTQSETTLLYMAARRVMQQITNKAGFRLHYRIETKFPKMAKWALTTGDLIFHWTRVIIDRENIEQCPDDEQLKKLSVFRTHFDPSKK